MNELTIRREQANGDRRDVMEVVRNHGLLDTDLLR